MKQTRWKRKGRISFEFPWRIDAKVEVNLTPQLLRLASKSLGNTAETSALIRMLDGIYVRTYDRTTVDVEELVNYFRWKLKVDAWETLVRIKGENETLEINLLFDEDKIYGVFASVIPKTPEEIIFVNIFGEIAPDRIETLLRSLDNFGVMAIDVRHKLRMLAVSTRRTGQRELLAVKVDYPPTIDGVLDDASWKIAPHADGFTHGYYEDPVADDSVVKMVYTRQAIYVGWHLYDSQPDKIVASQTKTRTAFKAGEDYVHLHDRSVSYTRGARQYQFYGKSVWCHKHRNSSRTSRVSRMLNGVTGVTLLPKSSKMDGSWRWKFRGRYWITPKQRNRFGWGLTLSGYTHARGQPLCGQM